MRCSDVPGRSVKNRKRVGRDKKPNEERPDQNEAYFRLMVWRSPPMMESRVSVKSMSVRPFQPSVRQDGKALIDQWPSPELVCQGVQSLEVTLSAPRSCSSKVTRVPLPALFGSNDEENFLLRGIWRKEVAENLLKGITCLPVLPPQPVQEFVKQRTFRGRRVVAGQAGCCEQQRGMLREGPRSQI